jgi:hypothetical protein
LLFYCRRAQKKRCGVFSLSYSFIIACSLSVRYAYLMLRALLFITFSLLIPIGVFAHTSDERYVDGFIVDLSTAPVSPWVGEKVGMSFVFRDPISLRATTSVREVTIEIDALMRPRTKVQEVIFQSQQFIVERGGFVMSYVFTEEGTYDLHATFIDAEGKKHIAGFRKQVRDGGGASRGIDARLFFCTLVVVSIFGFMGGRLSRAKHETGA